MNPMNMLGQMMGGNNPMGMMGGQGGVNPMQLIQMFQKSKGNPMQIMQSVMGNNPQYKRVMQMVDGKSPKEIKQVAMNLCEQNGVNFEQAVDQMRQMGIELPIEENPPENVK